MASQKRKVHALVSVASTSTSSASVGYDCAPFDDITFYINVTTVTAGGVTFTLEMRPGDTGAVWFPVPEAIGSTAQVTAAAAHRLAARAPVGNQVRLVYTIATGPVVFTYQAETSKRGHAGGGYG